MPPLLMSRVTRLVRANGDKPHRCPECHRIPDSARPRARWWRTHTCNYCGVTWWKGWSDLNFETWFVFPPRHLQGRIERWQRHRRYRR